MDTPSSTFTHDWFFDEWAGHPVFEISYEWNEAAKRVMLRAPQTQKTSEWVLHSLSLESFFEDRYNQETSYVAKAEALRSIGKSGDCSAIQFLQGARRVRSPRDIIHSAAEEAIQMLEKRR